jgi:hypothetical protein
MVVEQDQLSAEEQAAKAARLQFLQQQALGFLNQVRGLKIQLFMALDELPDELREYLYKELLQAAGIIEVKK